MIGYAAPPTSTTGDSYINESYSTGHVSDNTGALIDNYSAGQVIGPNAKSVGGLVGVNGAAAALSSGNFWDVTASGQSGSAVGHGMTTAQMQNEANFTSATAANGEIDPNWDFTHIWFLWPGSSPSLVVFGN